MNLKRLKFNIAAVLVLLIVLGIGIYIFVPKMLADTVYPLQYQNFIVKYSAKYNVDPALVAAVILQESRYNPRAVSGAGAQGLMQFMPSTASTMAKETGRWPKYDIFDPETSIEFGAAHLNDLLIKYNGNTEAALAAYNNGTGAVDSWISSGLLSKLNLRKSNSYVRKVMNYRDAYAAIYASELGLQPVTLTQKDQSSEVRGFVWSQIFSNFWGGLSSNKT